MVSVDDLLQPYQQRGVNLGLERIQQLLGLLGNPHQQIPILHVAGTNGKGSVCAYLSSVLTTAGYRVGRYISPHLVDICERITINQVPIPAQRFVAVLQRVEKALKQEAEALMATPFELITAAAWLYFVEEQVEIAVIEVGLGGRLDATNVCDRSLVSLITSISREHWQILGSTLAEIAGEKAGILKPGCPAVVGCLPTEAAAVVAAKAAAKDCPLTWVQPAQVSFSPDVDQVERLDLRGRRGLRWLESNGTSYPITLQGEFQLQNSALAIAAIQILRQQGWQISDLALQRGMGLADWPGRLQTVTWRGRELLIDGAHNPDAAYGLRSYVSQTYPHQAITWVMGMMANKDHAEVLKALLKPGDRLFLAPIPDHKSADPVVLRDLALQLGENRWECYACENLEQALTQAALDLAPTDPIVFCGSLYLIGHFFSDLCPASCG